MRPLPSSVAFLLAAVVATSCASSPPPLGSLPGEQVHTFVAIRTGPRTTPLAKAERGAMFQGHFDNMNRLARAGDLVMAGPYGKQKHANDLRGIFVLATGDTAAAKLLAETDPGFQQGEFRFEYTRIGTTADLRAQLAADLAREDAILASGKKPAPGDGGRAYVWLWAPSFVAASSALAGSPAVLLAARCEDGRGLFLLDAIDQVVAYELVAPHAVQPGDCELDEWFGSGLLVDLPKRSAR
jgi:uncharacterized protein YciI